MIWMLACKVGWVFVYYFQYLLSEFFVLEFVYNLQTYQLIFLLQVQKISTAQTQNSMQPEQPQTLIPTLRWAQKNQKIFITIALRDIKNQQIELNPTSISFTGTSNNKLYKFGFQLFSTISVEQSKTFKTGAAFLFQLVKDRDRRNLKWPRLNREAKRLSYVLIDWDRWDEQSQEEEQIKSGKFSSSGEQDSKQFGLKQAKADQIWDDNDDIPNPNSSHPQNYQDNDDYQENEQKQRNYGLDYDSYDDRDRDEDEGRVDNDAGDEYDERYEREQGRRGDDDD